MPAEIIRMGDQSERKRPVSFYDNELADTGDRSSNNNGTATDYKHLDNPTQTHCINTTVPQNIASPLIGGKHAPTRNSLRHSRMIVLNRLEQSVIPNDIPFIRLRKWLLGLLVTIFLLGGLLCLISLFFLLWSPNSRPRDNPSWSAVPILVSGIMGILFIRCFPKEFPVKMLTFWVKATKCTSIIASTLAAIACVGVVFLSISHVISIDNSVCTPNIPSDNTCRCRPNDNSTEETFFSSSYHYLEFNCSEVNTILRSMILFVCLVNIAVLFCELYYLYMHWTSRNIFYYSRVPDHGKELKVLKTRN